MLWKIYLKDILFQVEQDETPTGSIQKMVVVGDKLEKFFWIYVYSLKVS